VVIARPLITKDVQDTQFKTGAETPVALAVWNGEEREVNGKKSVSAWINVAVEKIPTAAGPTIDSPPKGGDFSRAPVVIDNSSNAALWALTGALAVLAALLVFVPAVMFLADRRKSA